MKDADDIMLRNPAKGRGRKRRYRLSDEEAAAFGSDGRAIRLPRVLPYVKFEAPDGRPGVEIGVTGDF